MMIECRELLARLGRKNTIHTVFWCNLGHQSTLKHATIMHTKEQAVDRGSSEGEDRGRMAGGAAAAHAASASQPVAAARPPTTQATSNRPKQPAAKPAAVTTMPASAITPRLWLGDVHDARDDGRNHGWTHILNASFFPNDERLSYDAAATLAGGVADEDHFLGLALEDTPAFDIAPHLQAGVDFIQRACSGPGSKVLVHCYFGANRSACLVAAWLLSNKATGDYDEDDAIAEVRRLRHLSREARDQGGDVLRSDGSIAWKKQALDPWYRKVIKSRACGQPGTVRKRPGSADKSACSTERHAPRDRVPQKQELEASKQQQQQEQQQEEEEEEQQQQQEPLEALALAAVLDQAGYLLPMLTGSLCQAH
jgi:protein-tyrosine phosphatase